MRPRGGRGEIGKQSGERDRRPRCLRSDRGRAAVAVDLSSSTRGRRVAGGPRHRGGAGYLFTVGWHPGARLAAHPGDATWCNIAAWRTDGVNDLGRPLHPSRRHVTPDAVASAAAVYHHSDVAEFWLETPSRAYSRNSLSRTQFCNDNIDVVQKNDF